MSAEGFSNTLGLLYAAGGKIDFFSAVAGCEMSYSFTNVDVSMAQQNNLAARL